MACPKIPARSSGLRRTRGGGFTLLEVLAAVSLLGIVYTVLADWAIQGLIAEGEASRRLEASLIADRALGELETQVEAGGAPPLGVTESESGDFRVRVEVSPLDLVLPGATTPAASRGRGDAAPDSEPGASLLFAAGPGTASALRRIEVHVTWTEGASEREVSRNTFALDRESVRPLLEQLDAEAASSGPQLPGLLPGGRQS